MRTTRRRALSICFIVACAWCAAASPADAQTAAGEITGIVNDQAGAAVPGATITVSETRTNFQRVTVSTGDGVYTAPSLAPGEYRVDVELAGFKPVRREGIRLSTGEKARIDFDLSVGDIQEQVTVVADSPVVRVETASLGTVVENEQVVQLPLNGRLFIMLAAIAPGVALPPNSVLPRINGGRPRTNEYLFDGISVLQPEPGQLAYYPIIDAIQEFKIESNSPAAEFGRFNGGVVNLTTKSGTNAVHGNVFEFFRNESLNARNYFQKSNPVKPDYKRNQYGGMFGGPLVRDRTFIFADYQGQRQSIGRTVTSNVPTLAERSGVFRQNIYDPATTVGNTRQQFPNNTIPTSAMDPVALSLLERYPLPTNSATANNYSRTANEIDDQDQGDVRLDHKFASNRDQVFGRLTYFRGHAEPVTAFPDGSGTIVAGSVAVGPQDTTAWAFASNYQRTFSPNLLNELRIGDTRRSVQRSAVALAGPAGAALDIPGIPSNAQFPNTMPAFAPNGYQQLGSPNNTASDFSTSVTQIADSLTWLKGRHTMKMGLDWRWERLNVIQPPWPTGSFVFSTVGSDLPGDREHRQRVCELPARTGADLCHRPPADGYSGTRALSGVLLPGRLEGVRAPHDQRGVAIHAQFPVHGDQRSNRGIQCRDAATRLSGYGAGPAAQEGQLRPAHWRRLPPDGQDHRQLGVREGLDRDGGNHDAFHDAELSVPAGRVAANARQHRTGLRAGEGTDRHTSRSDANRRSRTRRVRR
jgi:hypothetical protein